MVRIYVLRHTVQAAVNKARSPSPTHAVGTRRRLQHMLHIAAAIGILGKAAIEPRQRDLCDLCRPPRRSTHRWRPVDTSHRSTIDSSACSAGRRSAPKCRSTHAAPTLSTSPGKKARRWATGFDRRTSFRKNWIRCREDVARSAHLMGGIRFKIWRVQRRFSLPHQDSRYIWTDRIYSLSLGTSVGMVDPIALIMTA